MRGKGSTHRPRVLACRMPTRGIAARSEHRSWKLTTYTLPRPSRQSQRQRWQRTSTEADDVGKPVQRMKLNHSAGSLQRLARLPFVDSHCVTCHGVMLRDRLPRTARRSLSVLPGSVKSMCLNIYRLDRYHYAQESAATPLKPLIVHRTRDKHTHFFADSSSQR